jgi:hypothetical protein
MTARAARDALCRQPLRRSSPTEKSSGFLAKQELLEFGLIIAPGGSGIQDSPGSRPLLCA